MCSAPILPMSLTGPRVFANVPSVSASVSALDRPHSVPTRRNSSETLTQKVYMSRCCGEQTFSDHTDQVWGVAYNPSGTKFVSVGDDGSVLMGSQAS